MDVVLLWLDDLDDAVFVLISHWERLRRLCLQIGLFAAFTLAGCELSLTAAEWSLALASVAGSSVLIWSVGALLMAFAHRSGLTPALARA
jgi:hypothetical protein